MKAVNKRYQELYAADTTRSKPEVLSQAFEEGFEAVPWLRKVLGGFFPRVNWGFRWKAWKNGRS